MFRWVLIEIELDLSVDYKTSFTFVLATRLNQANITTQFSFALLDSRHRDINERFPFNLRVNVFRWVLIEIELDLCGRRKKVERKL